VKHSAFWWSVLQALLSKKAKGNFKKAKRNGTASLSISIWHLHQRSYNSSSEIYRNPAVAIPASEMVKTMMEEAAPKVNYLVQLETGPKKENAIKEQKEDKILEYAKKGAGYIEGYYDSYWKALKGEQVIDEKYTLENFFSGNLTMEDMPSIPEFINMVGATKGALARGVGNSLKGTYDTVKTLVTEPGKVWDAVSSGASDFIEHPIQNTKEFLGETFDGIVDAVWRSTPQDMAEDVGEIVGDVAVDALTAGSGAVIATGLKTGAKKLTISAGKTVAKTVTKTAGKTAIKEAGKKTIKELMPDATTVKKWIPKDLPINEGWLKNVVTAGGDINALKKNNYQLILPNDKKSIKDVLQKTSKNTAKETVGEFAENKAVNLTKDKIVKKVKNKTVSETKNEVGDATKKVVGEYSKKTGDGVHTSPAVSSTEVNTVENISREQKLDTKDLIKKENKNFQVGKDDIDKIRKKLNVPETHTVAVGKTNVPGLEDLEFEGLSPKVRQEVGLKDLDEINPNREIKYPGQNYLFKKHAEEDIANEFIKAVEKANILPENVIGILKIHQSNPTGVCRKCIQGLKNNSVSPGVLKQLSQKYPHLRIEVTSETLPNIKVTGRSTVIIQNGTYIE
jgi:hypothetical protein